MKVFLLLIKEKKIRDSTGHMYMMIWMIDLFGFVYVLDKIIFGSEFKLMLTKKDNQRALSRFSNDDAGSVATGTKTFYQNIPDASNFL